MRTSCWLILALAVIVFGCDGKKEAAPPPAAINNSEPKSDPAPKSDPSATPDNKTPAAGDNNPTPAPQPANGWTQNLQEMRFPETAAAGRMLGQAFTPQVVEISRISGRFLSLRQGEEFNPDFELKILLSGAKDENFAGKTFEIAPDAEPGTAKAISLLWKSEGRQQEPKQFVDGKYALRLEFGQENDGRLPGKIYLCLPDEAKSYVAGTFSAAVEPDYSQPPRAHETPCILGRIVLRDKEKGLISAGVIGQTADGKRVTNATGTTVTPEGPDSETSISTVGPDLPQLRTSLVNDAQAGCQCRHVHLAPGRYLVFVGWGDRYIDWRWVEVKDKAIMDLTFVLEPKQAGGVEVTLPKDGNKDDLRVIPLDDNGKLPEIAPEVLLSLSLAMKFDDVPVKDGKMVLDGMRPGRYRVGVGAVEKDVVVKVNERVTVDLSAP